MATKNPRQSLSASTPQQYYGPGGWAVRLTGNGSAGRGLKREIRGSVETRVGAQGGALDARRMAAESEGAPLHLREHPRRELIPGAQHAATEQVQREVENVDQVRKRGAKRRSHRPKDHFRPFVPAGRQMENVLRRQAFP